MKMVPFMRPFDLQTAIVESLGDSPPTITILGESLWIARGICVGTTLGKSWAKSPRNKLS